MRARSIAAWAAEPELRALELDVVLLEALEGKHPMYTFGVWLYNWIQRTMPRLHHIYFNVLEYFPSCKSAKYMPGHKAFIEKIKAINPNVVVSVHDHLNHGFFELVHMAFPESPPPCITYCGELFGGYGFSKHWVNPRADYFMGAVKETCMMAERLRMAHARNEEAGFLLDPSFSRNKLTDSERNEYIRSEWGFDPDQFILLLGTGANGANNHCALLSALHKARIYPQVVALCGKDTEALKAVESWQSEHTEIPVKALGYTRDMARIFQCVSAIVARPGTGTTSEAIVSGCPVIFNGIGGIMPQEWITVKFFKQYKVSAVIRRPRQLPAIVDRWMKDSSAYAAHKRAVAQLPHRHKPAAILRTFHAFGEKHRLTR